MKRMNEMLTGESAVVVEMNAHGSIRRRFLDLGLVLGTRIECVGKAPSKDPCAYLIRGAVIAIRSQDCSEIYVD